MSRRSTRELSRGGAPDSVSTRVRFHFVWHATTQELTAAGAWSILLLAVTDSSGTGYESLGSLCTGIADLGLLFNRWRALRVSAHWCGQASSTVSETSAIKYLPEAITSAAEASDWYEYTEGDHMGFHLPYQSTVSSLTIPRGVLATAGLPWLQTENASDNEGCAGTLLFFTSYSTAESIRVHVDVELEFSGLVDKEIDFVPRSLGQKGALALAKRLHRRAVQPPSPVASAMSKPVVVPAPARRK